MDLTLMNPPGNGSLDPKASKRGGCFQAKWADQCRISHVCQTLGYLGPEWELWSAAEPHRGPGSAGHDAHLVDETAQDGQVSGRVGSKDVACGVDPRHRQDPAGEVHEGVCEEDMLLTASWITVHNNSTKQN